VSSAPERRPGPAAHQDPGASDPAIRTVGVIGAGRIGQPIIGHLVRKGFVVVANDADGSKQEAVERQGARWAELAELARDAGAILICVGYDRDLRVLMDEGLINKVSAGASVVVLSTVQPRTVQELEEIARYKGVAVVDATMCRGGRAADTGTMLSFVAGDPAVIERLKPVVSAYSTDIVYTGAVGTAQAAKAANNLLMWACLIANHEALALAQRFGVDVELLRTALQKTGADNGVLRNWGTSTMAWADDDLEIIQSMAEDAGIALPQAELNRELCRALKPKKFQLDQYGDEPWRRK
jgi:3-hydroxyisobutyrate dehydrogenase-like beta-hydroxyacid dehydrogenase